MRLKIQRVKSVPPIPTMIIVIPNVQLSILRYLLLIKVGGRGQRVKATSFASNSKPQTLNPVLYTTLEKDFQQKK